jgi:hypothetical protein
MIQTQILKRIKECHLQKIQEILNKKEFDINEDDWLKIEIYLVDLVFVIEKVFINFDKDTIIYIFLIREWDEFLEIISDMYCQGLGVQKEEEESKVEECPIWFDNKYILKIFYEFKNDNYFENERND